MRHRLALLAIAALALTACAARAEPLARPAAVTAPSPVTTSTTAAPVPEPPPCEQPVAACVRLSTKQAWLLASGAGPVPISHGGTAHPTPTGTFPVVWKDAEHTSSIYGDSMPFSVFFAPGGIAFHQGDLATDSHGCVRLDLATAQAFFATLNPGDLVQVLA